MLLLAVVAVALACAVALRRSALVRDGLAVASSTLLALTGALVPAFVVMAVVRGPARPVLTLLAAAAGAVLAVHAGRWLNEAARSRAHQRAGRAGDRPGVGERIDAFVRAHPVTIAGYPVLLLTVRGARRSVDVRVTGLAAEMSYYALISLVPLGSALGAGLGFLERALGEEDVARIEATLVDTLAGVFDERVAADVLAPLIESLLREERTGVAVGGVLVALWLTSRMFRAAVRALDDAYRVPERRGFLSQHALGLGLSLGAVATLLVLLAMVVVGPLLGGERQLASWFGATSSIEVLWTWLRWPTVVVVCTAYLTLLYRFAPNIATTWRRCLPGAVVGMLGLVAVALAFQAYLTLAGPTTPDLARPGGAVGVAGQMLAAVLAGVLWLWLSSIVILAGGVLNAELDRFRGQDADERAQVAPRDDAPAGPSTG
ncbi:YihY/virulence factor BrkB family protein [Oerskovia flava]|uniref:YihY/virulence factor BrkB family protein n=1 Tax=Oerskovia flava TaxID=2986422 RepID=UPI00223FF9A7|nr:YihY/virulence factor BrkB family protein [Oerskovia sp. JB1-3-2]